MSNASLRAAMVPYSRRVRAYFAPVNREAGMPVVFDPAKHGSFASDIPASPWLSLGWIENFQRVARMPVEAVRGGARGTTISQFRGAMDAQIEFDFREWGKLQLALACGSEHMNALATVANADAQPSGGTAVAAIGLLPGSSSSELVVGAGSVDFFPEGCMVAVDVDYQQQTGYVGTGIAAAYIEDAADVQRDRDYVRRVTFNVGRVIARTASSLVLAEPLPGGTPGSGAGVQKVIAFVDREGGSFLQEWSGLFIAEQDCGGRACFYYPRLSPVQSAVAGVQRETAIPVHEGVHALALHAAFTALPYVDENDGQPVLAYRSYFPAPAAAVY
ncbi:MAG TPA: hypothetical protein VFA68_07580 [Terriglobales bacterium]|nr:hypothetical protein [Terriglobales bacterium]